MNKKESYHAYLLRIWRDDEQSPWRAMLECTHTGNRHNFADLEKLVSFIQNSSEEGNNAFVIGNI